MASPVVSIRSVTPPTLRAIVRAWIDIGTQSVGGGTSTLFMMRRVLVEQRRWTTLREFTEAYALSQLSPGIHFVALAGLLGQRLAGPWGALAAVGGMMIPASIITVVITMFFNVVADHPLAIAALAGVGPVAAGMTLGLAFTLARPIIQRGPRGLVDVAVTLFAFGLVVAGVNATVIVIVGSGVFGALLLRRGRPTSADTEMS